MSKQEILLTDSAVDFLKEETGATTVRANPTLEGTEVDLTGLEVDGVKYAVPQGGGDGQHLIKVKFNYAYEGDPEVTFVMTYVTDTTLQTFDDLYDYLINKFGDVAQDAEYSQPVFAKHTFWAQGTRVDGLCCCMDAFFEDDTKCIEIILPNGSNVYIQTDEHFSITYFD